MKVLLMWIDVLSRANSMRTRAKIEGPPSKWCGLGHTKFDVVKTCANLFIAVLGLATGVSTFWFGEFTRWWWCQRWPSAQPPTLSPSHTHVVSEMAFSLTAHPLSLSHTQGWFYQTAIAATPILLVLAAIIASAGGQMKVLVAQGAEASGSGGSSISTQIVRVRFRLVCSTLGMVASLGMFAVLRKNRFAFCCVLTGRD